MIMNVVKISPKGQFSIPKEYREKVEVKYFLFELEGKNIVLKPLEIRIMEVKKNEKRKSDELTDFGKLAGKAFSFWDNEDDDVYQNFYKA